MHPHAKHVLDYLAALEARVPFDTLAAFFTSDAVQRELPNRLLPTGMTRDLEGLRKAAAAGKNSVASERYVVRRIIADGDAVAVEADWSAVLNVPLGKLAAGDTLRAALGMFFTFEAGRIKSLNNYDCFDPF